MATRVKGESPCKPRRILLRDRFAFARSLCKKQTPQFQPISFERFLLDEDRLSCCFRLSECPKSEESTLYFEAILRNITVSRPSYFFNSLSTPKDLFLYKMQHALLSREKERKDSRSTMKTGKGWAIDHRICRLQTTCKRIAMFGRQPLL